MKVTALYGSPRKQGNSSTMVDEFIRTSGAEANRFYLYDMDIHNCRGCGGCAKKCACVQDDDMQKIYASIAESDAIVMGSPLYWWSVSAALKTVVDRLYIYIGKNRLKGKKLILLVSGFSDIPNSGYDLIEAVFKEVSAYLELDYRSLYVSADDTRHVRSNPEILEEIAALAKQVQN